MDAILQTPLGWGLFMGAIFAMASFLQGITGIGFALVIMGLATLVEEPQTMVPIIAVMAICNSSSLAWFWRKQIRFREVLPMALIAVLFIPVGAYFLKAADKSLLIRILGAVLIVLSLLSIFRTKGSKLFGHPVAKWVASVCSGLTGGAFTMAGPPLAVYAYNCHWPLDVARANLQILFAVVSVVACATHAINQILTMERLLIGLGFMPVVLLFSWLGSRAARHVSSERLGLCINCFLISMGLLHLIRG